MGEPAAKRRRLIVQDGETEERAVQSVLNMIASKQKDARSRSRRTTKAARTALSKQPKPEKQSQASVLIDENLVEARDQEKARLVTYMDGNKHCISVKPREQAFLIGRHASTNFCFPGENKRVSNFHGRLYAIEADTAESLTCYEDTSSLGTKWNDILLHHRAVLLNHGDTLTIGKQLFTYEHRALPGLAPDHGLSPTGKEDKDFSLRHYRVSKRTLGSGAFSVVRLAIDERTKSQYACKMLRVSFLKQRGYWESTQREIEHMREMHHPNLNGLQDIYMSEQYVYMIMDLVTGGDLFSYVTRPGKGQLEGHEAKYIFYQILLGLQHLHDKLDLAHRDIKPENIILRGLGPLPLVMITDFGTVMRVQKQRTQSFVGTVFYWAPECFVSTYCPKALDVFSAGCVLYLMIRGRLPFDGSAPTVTKRGKRNSTADSSADLRALQALREDVEESLTREERLTAIKIMNGSISFAHSTFSAVDRNAVDLIRNMLATDERYRLTIRDALAHGWIIDALQDLEKKYKKDMDKLKMAK